MTPVAYGLIAGAALGVVFGLLGGAAIDRSASDDEGGRAAFSR
jgi:hypothetical protein